MNDDDVKDSTDTNRAHWEEISVVYSSDPALPVEAVLGGASSIPQVEVVEIGDVTGLEGIHLQAGIGLDTITLARMGAKMTGIDISARACEIASSLAQRCNVDVSFIQGNVLDRDQLPANEFDFVYTSHGVLRWLPSLERWANTIFSLLRPGGWLYLFEIHPLLYHLSSTDKRRFTLEGDYFDEAPHRKEVSTTHFGSADSLEHRAVVHTNWTIGSIVGCVLESGLRLDSLKEHPSSSYSRKGLLPVKRDGLWTPEYEPPMPLSFSLRATRE